MKALLSTLLLACSLAIAGAAAATFNLPPTSGQALGQAIPSLGPVVGSFYGNGAGITNSSFSASVPVPDTNHIYASGFVNGFPDIGSAANGVYVWNSTYGCYSNAVSHFIIRYADPGWINPSGSFWFVVNPSSYGDLGGNTLTTRKSAGLNVPAPQSAWMDTVSSYVSPGVTLFGTNYVQMDVITLQNGAGSFNLPMAGNFAGDASGMTNFVNLGVFNLKDFGAKGGANDDAPALRAALAAAKANGGGTVLIPKGTWTFSSTNGITQPLGWNSICLIPANVTVSGPASGCAYVKVGNSVPAYWGSLFVTEANATNVEVRNLTIDLNAAGRGLATNVYSWDAGVIFNGGTNHYAHDLTILNAPNEGVDLMNSVNCFAERCCVTNSNGSGFSCAGVNQVVRDCTVWKSGFIEGMWTGDPRHWGAAVTISAGAINVTVQHLYAVSNYCGVQCFSGNNVVIEDCNLQSWGTNYCINVYAPAGGSGCNPSQDVRIVNNRITADQMAYGVRLVGVQWSSVVEGNTLINAQLTLDNCTAPVVQGNFIYGHNKAGVTPAILTQNGTAATISGNTINNAAEDGILLKSPFSLVSGNNFVGNGFLDLEGSTACSNVISGNFMQTTAPYSIYISGPTNYIMGNHCGKKPVRFTASQGRPDGNWLVGNYFEAVPVRDGGANPAGNQWYGNTSPTETYAPDHFGTWNGR